MRTTNYQVICHTFSNPLTANNFQRAFPSTSLLHETVPSCGRTRQNHATQWYTQSPHVEKAICTKPSTSAQVYDIFFVKSCHFVFRFFFRVTVTLPLSFKRCRQSDGITSALNGSILQTYLTGSESTWRLRLDSLKSQVGVPTVPGGNWM